MLLPPLDEREPDRVMTPGHFENFVGVRVSFADDVDDAMSSPARDLADLADTDVEGDTAGEFRDLVDGIDDIDRSSDPGDLVGATTAANELELELIDQSVQPLPPGGPGVVPQDGTEGSPPIVAQVPTPPPADPSPGPREQEPLP